jgi:hypothetical protein
VADARLVALRAVFFLSPVDFAGVFLVLPEPVFVAFAAVFFATGFLSDVPLAAVVRVFRAALVELFLCEVGLRAALMGAGP